MAQKEGTRRLVVEAKGATYSGEWKDNLRHGKGERTWQTARGQTLVYDGEWHEGKRHGKGTLYRLSRTTGGREVVYEGDWAGDSQHGNGTWHMPNGDVYSGQLERGKRQGYGTYRFANGDVYEGQFFDDCQEGLGTLFMAHGQEKYVGEWSHGRKHGRGEFHFSGKGKVYRGVWADGHAKCGEMIDVASPTMPGAVRLPELELRDPVAVLEESEQRTLTTLVDETDSVEHCVFIDVPTDGDGGGADH
jgi:hypothetical protein